MVKSVWWVVVLLGRQQPSKLCSIFLLESPWPLEGHISPNIHPFEANKHANPTFSFCLTQRGPLFHLKRTRIGWDLTISVGSTFSQQSTTCPFTFGPLTPTYNLKQGSIFCLHCVEIRFALWSVAKFPLCQELQPILGQGNSQKEGLLFIRNFFCILKNPKIYSWECAILKNVNEQILGFSRIEGYSQE